MKTLFGIFSLTFLLLMMWGCKKDSIVDDNGPQLIDSLAWMDSINGHYHLIGTSNYSFLITDSTGSHYISGTDTIDWLLDIEVLNDSSIQVLFPNSTFYKIMDRTNANAIKATYFRKEYDDMYLTFINDQSDSIYYQANFTGHTGGSITKLAGIRIP